MGEGSSWVWLVGILAVGLALVLLFTATPEAPTVPAESPPSQVSVVSQASQAAHAAHAVTLPIVNAGKDLILDERETVRLMGEGHDPSGGAVTTYWAAEGGRGRFDDPYRPQPVYTAPTICGCEECIRLTLTVTNAQGVSASDQMWVRVRGDPITCPTLATWGPCECPPRPCDVPCVPPVRPTKRCEPEPPPCEVPCVPLISPPEPCAPLPVPCVCEPPCGWPCDQLPCGPTWTYPLSLELSVPCPPGVRPTPHINRHYPATVNEGGSVQLHGRVSNPGCRPVCFLWKADKGWFDDPSSLNPIWHASMSDRCGGEDACITLTVMDACNGRGYDQIRIHINNLDYWRTDSLEVGSCPRVRWGERTTGVRSSL